MLLAIGATIVKHGISIPLNGKHTSNTQSGGNNMAIKLPKGKITRQHTMWCGLCHGWALEDILKDDYGNQPIIYYMAYHGNL